LLPPEPKIFYGRELELSAILQVFGQEVARIAILGAGGMGKTSLARAVLHRPELASRYEENRFFVPCDTVTTSVQLSALIGAQIGMKPGNNLTQSIIRHFSSGPPTLLILDNLETIWEPPESRGDVEKFLCLLTEVEHLALIVSMDPEVSLTYTNTLTDYNARSRETCQCPVDSPFSGAIEALGTGCCSSNLH
jgi:hypothetical protein